MLAEIFFKCHSLFVLLSSFWLECSTLGHIRSLLKGGHTQDLNTMWRKIPTSPPSQITMYIMLLHGSFLLGKGTHRGI